MEARRVESRQPHVSHEHDAQGIVRVAEPLGEPLPARLVSDMLLPVQGIRRRAGHHDLDGTLAVILVVPFWTQANQLAVQVDAYATAHADDHRFTFHRFQPLFEVFHDVFSDLQHALLCSDDRFQLGPLCLEFLRALDLFALGGLLEVGVDHRFFALVKCQLGKAALVVDGHSRLVFHGAPDVVDANVVAEDGPRVGVLELDGGAGKADERGIWEGVAHVAGVPVDEVVLASVGLVGDDDDVAPLGEGRVRVAFLFGEELLNGREDDSRDVHGELIAEVGPALCLRGRLAEEVLAAGECAEELVVEVVAVGEHHYGRVFHCLLSNDRPGVEGHCQALAGPLRVPDHSYASIASRPTRLSARLVAPSVLGDSRALQLCGPQGLVDSHSHSVELVVAGNLLNERATTVVLEYDEVADKGEEPLRIEYPLQHHLELGHLRTREGFSCHGAPGLEPFPARGQRADTRFISVGDHERLVHRK